MRPESLNTTTPGICGKSSCKFLGIIFGVFFHIWEKGISGFFSFVLRKNFVKYISFAKDSYARWLSNLINGKCTCTHFQMNRVTDVIDN